MTIARMATGVGHSNDDDDGGGDDDVEEALKTVEAAFPNASETVEEDEEGVVLSIARL